MRAIDLREGRAMRVGDPEPREGDVLIEPTHVLAADLARAGGESPCAFVGRICRNGTTGPAGGVRVLASTFCPCGACDVCRGGLSEHCREGGLARLIEDGALCSRVAVRPAGLVPLPDELDDESALLAPLVARALHAAGRIRIEGKPYVTVLGDGPAALVCGQLMAKLNASVRVLGDEPARFGLCEKWGIKHRHVDEVGRRQDQDVVVETTGGPEMLELACGLVRPRGKVVLLGRVAEDAGSGVLIHAMRDELEVVGVRSGPLDAAVATLVRGELDVVSLIERRSRIAPGRAFAGDPRALVEVVDVAFAPEDAAMGEAA